MTRLRSNQVPLLSQKAIRRVHRLFRLKIRSAAFRHQATTTTDNSAPSREPPYSKNVQINGSQTDQRTDDTLGAYHDPPAADVDRCDGIGDYMKMLEA